jgi:hypothetical protein
MEISNAYPINVSKSKIQNPKWYKCVKLNIKPHPQSLSLEDV